jgi:hypothetical protein
MHKTARPKKIPQKKLERALFSLEWMGLPFRGKEEFFNKQMELLKRYIADPNSSKKNLKAIRYFLKEIGAKTKPPEKVVAKYNCPRLGMIYAPCREKGCMFWGNFPSQLNCASKYMKEQGRNTLTVAEMGIFSSYSRSRINDILKSAMTKLRRDALKSFGTELFGSEKELDFKSPEVGTCCVCEKATTNSPGFYSTPGDVEKYTYCSFSCWVNKSPTSFFIGMNTGGNTTEILNHLPRRYNSLEESARCLTVPLEKLRNLMFLVCPDNSLLKDEDQPILEVRERGKRFWERQLEKWSESTNREKAEA